jgi:bromodomain-containing factor 1
MSAQEQEARIAQLKDLRDLYKPGQEPADAAVAAAAAAGGYSHEEDQSSDESSSEEE